AQKCSAMLSRWLSGVKPTRGALKNLVFMVKTRAKQYDGAILEKLNKIIESDLRFERIVEIRQVETPPYTYDFEVRPEGRDLENFLGGTGYICLHNTAHKKKADKTSKEEYLLLMPIELADAHLKGEIHIHDLEYFGTRPFCLSPENVLVCRVGGIVKLTTVGDVFTNLDYKPSSGFETASCNSVEVLTPEGFVRVAKVSRRSCNSILRITTERGFMVELTEEHRVPLADGRLVEARMVKPGDKLKVMATPNYEDISLNTSEVNGVVITPELARLIGYFIADGNYDVKVGEFYNLVFTFDKSSEVLIGDVCSIIKGLGFNYTVYDHSKRAMREIQIIGSGRKLYELLHEKLGIRRVKAPDKRLPEWVLNLPRKLLVEVLRGLIAGNGGIHASKEKGGFIQISSTSKTLIEQLQLIFSFLGLKTRTYLRIRRGSTGVKKSGEVIETKHDVWTIVIEGKREVEDALRLGLAPPGLEASLVKAAEAKEGYHPLRAGVDIVKTVEPISHNEYAYDIYLDRVHVFYAGSGVLVHNCQDWDLRYFFYYGFMPDGMGIKTSVARAAQRAEVAVLHSVKVLAAAQTNFSGGEGFYNYLVFLAPYIRGLSYDNVKQLMQMMFYELTQIYVARGGQPVFSNIQIAPGVPKLWEDAPIVARGRIGPDKYGEYKDEVRVLYRALNEVALQGDYWGKPFNFPKLENGIIPELFNSEYDEEWLLAHKVVTKFGSPYFDNMIPEYRGYGKGVSCYQCCAYNFVDTPDSDPEFEEKLYFVGGKHFSMGSWQVVTVNLPRAAYKSKGEDDRLYEEVKRLMETCVDVFKTKHQWMKLMIENNRIPFATQRPRDPITGERGPPPVNFEELVWTIGIVGVNEMVQYHTGYQLHESDEAVKVAIRLILEMKSYLKELEEKSGFKLALARTPAESCAQRLAVCDLIDPEFGEAARKVVKGDLESAERLLTIGERDVPIYYSNGTHVYVGARIPLLERMRIENRFFPVLNGGNMFHIWLGEASSDPEALYRFTKRIAMQTQIGYFAYTKDLTICEDCNRVSGGLNSYCLECGSTRVRWWSRVTGYYQEVKGWNRAKRHEFFERYRVSIT
ncbi:anaerobic ribonucleoside-triphosphate reductase, partial [Candidatus Bathyarchaeota archaeon]|nr:anaerobic ribonucleoside-triphosphate reductase [Candidatus Bathyarchaeota archaeon]